MASILGDIRRSIASRIGLRRRADIVVAAFGKHPGWDDHIGDIGLDTEPLVTIKRMLYVQGIGGNLDSGAWDKLRSEHRLDGFRHVFAFLAADDMILGRMWSSRDGKGRSLYPMVVSVHGQNISAAWLAEHGLGRLAEMETACIGAASEEEVRSIVAKHGAELRSLSKDATRGCEPALPGALAELADCRELGFDQQGALRILYATSAQMRAFTPDVEPRAARSVRVPRCNRDDGSTILFWLGLLRTYVPVSTPLLVLLRPDEEWVDVVVGVPTKRELFCLQVGPEALPLTHEIPYTLDDEFVLRARHLIEESRNHTAPQQEQSIDRG